MLSRNERSDIRTRFLSLVAERPPKVAVGFHPFASAEPSRQTISSRSDDRTIATPSAAQGIESLAEETMVLETVSSHGNRMTCDRARQVPNRPWKLTKPQPQKGNRLPCVIRPN